MERRASKKGLRVTGYGLRITKLKVGIIGCGTIGGEVALACVKRFGDDIDLVGLCDIDADKAKALCARLGGKVRILGRGPLISASGLVVEAASAAVSADIAAECLKKGRDILVMSVGGLLGRDELLSGIEKSTSRVYIPSGAICGIDGVKAASIGKITSIGITTRKPPRSLEGAPYIIENNIDLKGIDKETILFDGTAKEAVSAFPKNINVAAVLSLASGVGARDVRVRIVTSPEYTRNVHEVEVMGDFGKITTRTENLPSAANPKTSALAVSSAIAMLGRISSRLMVGT